MDQPGRANWIDNIKYIQGPHGLLPSSKGSKKVIKLINFVKNIIKFLLKMKLIITQGAALNSEHEADVSSKIL